jgi:hypothetical protein
MPLTEVLFYKEGVQVPDRILYFFSGRNTQELTAEPQRTAEGTRRNQEAKPENAERAEITK